MSVVDLLDDGRGEVLKGLVRPLGIEKVDPLEGSDLDMVDVAQRPFRLICSALNEPIVDSASALS